MGNQVASRRLLLGILIALMIICQVNTAKQPAKDHEVAICTNQKYNSTTGILYAKVGSTLQLNCTALKDERQVVWKVLRGLQIGTSIKSLGNSSVVEYKVKKVEWSMNMTLLWCGVRRLHQNRGLHLTLIVGDVPSPPQTFTKSIVDVLLFKVFLHWNPATYTGGLAAYYKVTYNPCYSKTCIPYARECKFCLQPHVAGKNTYSCFMQRDNMMVQLSSSLRLGEVYRIKIVTVNEIGSSSDVSMIISLGYGGEKPFMPTPLPPSNLRVAKVSQNYITLEWKARDYKLLYNPKYIITYHAEGQPNKTLSISRQSMVTLRDGIKQYTKYYIYLVVEVHDGNTSQASKAIGPVTTVTDAGKPDQGPDITEFNSKVYENNSDIRDVVLQWKGILVSSWKGKPSNITVMYYNLKAKKQNSTDKLIRLPVSNNTSMPRNITLTGLNSNDNYKVYTILCNTKECGGKGPEKLVKSLLFTKVSARQGAPQDILRISITLIVIVGLIIIIAIPMASRLRAQRIRVRPPPLDEIVRQDQLHPVGIMYTNAADTSTGNKYSNIESQQA